MRAWVQRIERATATFLGLEQSAYWFERRGYEVVRFAFDDLARGRLDEDLLEDPEETVLAASVECVREVLPRAKRPLPPNIDLPDALAAWHGREVWHTTLGKIRTDVDEPTFTPCHIKPLHQHKLFTGTVVREFGDIIPTASHADAVAVLAQELVEFVSEWRAYVLRDEIIHVGRYRGDPLQFPDPRAMNEALKAFADRPIAFGMDWGVVRTGETLLVEVNDGYALGNYGLRGPEYTAMLEARWRELMGLPDNGIGRTIGE